MGVLGVLALGEALRVAAAIGTHQVEAELTSLILGRKDDSLAVRRPRRNKVPLAQKSEPRQRIALQIVHENIPPLAVITVHSEELASVRKPGIGGDAAAGSV